MTYKIDIRQYKKLSRGIAVRSALILLAAMTVVGIAFPVYADQYDEKIKDLQNAATTDQQSVDTLQGQANDLNAQISGLQSQIASTQSQIEISEEQHATLTKQIDQAQKELSQQREVLGKNIKAMYLEGKVSTVEMLASSDNFSDYLDKQQYRDTVKDKVTETVKKIATLKKDLSEKRTKVAKLLEDQKKMRDELASKEAQAAGLLAKTNADKDQFQKSIDSKRDEITKLRAEQVAANQRYGGVASYAGSSSYPWANEGYPCSGADPWGMCFRQCVSYTAWKVASTGRNMPYWGGNGNANQWPGNARAAGIKVDSSPKAGDVAIGYWGPYGHAMYVERVLGNGQIYVSQYNYEVQGLYSEMTVSSSGLEFIHF